MTLQVEEQDTKNMKIVNNLGCSWINDLDKRSSIKKLDKNKSCDWLIIGAGDTGKGSLYRSIFYVCSQNFQ